MEKDKKEAVLIVIFIGQDNYVHGSTVLTWRRIRKRRFS